MNHKVLAAAIIIISLASCGRKKQDAVEIVEPEIPPLGFFTDQFSSDTIKVKSGETFSNLFNRLGMSTQDAFSMSTLCDSVFDVRKLRAGNELHAFYTDTDSTRKLQYVVYIQDIVRSTVFRCADSLAVWNVDKPVEEVRKFTDVTITSSLWNDLIAAGASPNLIMDLADIYQWSVNFFTLQDGDRFRVVYNETLCEGEVVSIDTVHFSLFTPESGREVGALRFDTPDGANTYWDKGGESLKRMFLKAPLKYNRVSSRFTYHRRHPVSGKVKPHTAVDYAAPTGTPVHAIGDGTVTKCGWDPSGGGNRIRIKHIRGYESCYMHLSRFASGIRAGSRVSQGQLIGYVGATGTATGPHLDFRIWEKGKPLDPLTLDSPASNPLSKEYLTSFNALYDKYMAEVSADSTSVLPGDSLIVKADAD